MTARMEKVREALERYYDASARRGSISAALAEVEEWEARMGKLSRVPITPERLRELQEAEVRAEAAEASLALLREGMERMKRGADNAAFHCEAAEAEADRLREMLKELLPWAGKQTFVNDEVWVKARALVEEDE